MKHDSSVEKMYTEIYILCWIVKCLGPDHQVRPYRNIIIAVIIIIIIIIIVIIS